MGLRIRPGKRANRWDKPALESAERRNAVTTQNAEPEAPEAGPSQEQERKMDCETLERMPLESLLYYVLVGQGRKKKEEAA